MFKDEQGERGAVVSDAIQRKLAELAELVAAEEYGAEGAGKELSFREIEEVSYKLGQLTAEKFATTATQQQQRHFDTSHACPQCGALSQPGDPVERKLLTRLGSIDLSEIEFHCDACRRSFFPSAGRTSS